MREDGRWEVPVIETEEQRERRREREARELERQSSRMASEAQRGWSRANPIKSCLLTTFAVVFLGIVAIFLVLAGLGFFDHLG